MIMTLGQMYAPQSEHLSMQANNIGTSTSANNAPASTNVANANPTSSAIYNLEQSIMGNNANYQGMMSNNQSQYLSTASNLASTMGSQIGQGSKKGGGK